MIQSCSSGAAFKFEKQAKRGENQNDEPNCGWVKTHQGSCCGSGETGDVVERERR
jgi:hypothetical protein